jgi:hypothetical protein
LVVDVKLWFPGLCAPLTTTGVIREELWLLNLAMCKWYKKCCHNIWMLFCFFFMRSLVVHMNVEAILGTSCKEVRMQRLLILETKTKN